MIKSEYFASPIYHEDKPEWVEKLNRLCDPYIDQAIKSKEDENNKKLTLGYKNDIGMTYHSEALEPDENFRFFHNYMAEKTRWCLDDMGYDMSNYKLFFTESWVQEFSHNGAGHHWFHTHSNNHISGFYFLKCNEKTSHPVFHDPRPGKIMTDLLMKDSTKINYGSGQVHYKVKPGDFMFFNSYMPHAYVHHSGKDKFRFVHFNLQAVIDPAKSQKDKE